MTASATDQNLSPLMKRALEKIEYYGGELERSNSIPRSWAIDGDEKWRASATTISTLVRMGKLVVLEVDKKVSPTVVGLASYFGKRT